FQTAVWKDRMYVRTNDGAPNWRVFRVDDIARAADRTTWKEIVPERKDMTLEGAAIVGGRIVLRYLKDVATRLEVRELDGRPVREIELPAIGSANVSGDPEDDEAFYSFNSFTYPTEIHSMSMRTGEQSLWYRIKVPVEPSQFDVEQVFYHSKDGTRVPMFIVHKKGLVKDGSAPTILTGYGGFRIAQAPNFSAAIYAWLERGGVYAVANLRGGSEYGEEWHQAGWRDKKQNVFDDFVAAAEYLSKNRYTRPDRLALRGGSNGGLLVG